MKQNQKLVSFVAYMWKVFSHISLGLLFVRFRNCDGSQPWIQIIIIAWSFEAKLLKLFLMHSKQLFIRPQYCQREHCQSELSATTPRLSWKSFLVPLLDSYIWFLALHLVLYSLQPKPFRPNGFPIHSYFFSHLFHVVFFSRVFCSVVFVQ